MFHVFLYSVVPSNMSVAVLSPDVVLFLLKTFITIATIFSAESQTSHPRDDLIKIWSVGLQLGTQTFWREILNMIILCLLQAGEWGWFYQCIKQSMQEM